MYDFDLSTINFPENDKGGRIAKKTCELSLRVHPRETAQKSNYINLSIPRSFVAKHHIDRLTAAIVRAGDKERLYIVPYSNGFKGTDPHSKRSNRTYYKIRIAGELKGYFRYEGDHDKLEYDPDNKAFYIEL